MYFFQSPNWFTKAAISLQKQYLMYIVLFSYHDIVLLVYHIACYHSTFSGTIPHFSGIIFILYHNIILSNTFNPIIFLNQRYIKYWAKIDVIFCV